MKFPGFVGPSYQLSSVKLDCQRSVNLYVEIDEQKTGEQAALAMLKSTPGLSTPLITLATSPIRAQYLSSNGLFYVLSGNTLYGISSSFASTTIGTVTSSMGPAWMFDNGSTLFLVDGTAGWQTQLGSTSLTQNTTAGFAGYAAIPSQGAFQDGYFIFPIPGTNTFIVSDNPSVVLQPTGTITFTGDGLLSGSAMVGAKGTNPDPIIGCVSSNRNLWFFGRDTTEVWYNAGNPAPGVPFSLIQGGYLEIGLAAQYSIQKIHDPNAGDVVVFVGRDKAGTGVVYKVVGGYSPQRVSTHAIEKALQTYGDLSTSTSWIYQENGHQFYVLNCPNAPTSWCLDLTNGFWHERVFLSGGIFQRHLAQCHTYFNNIHIVGDYQSGNLYQLSSSIYSDNGNPMSRQRTYPHLPIDTSLDRIFYSSMQIDIEAGVGIDGTGQGVNPQMMMQFSNDGGRSWSSELWQSMGKIGQLKYRARWFRLGAARDRVFRITVTDPVSVVLVDAELELQKGMS